MLESKIIFHEVTVNINNYDQITLPLLYNMPLPTEDPFNIKGDMVPLNITIEMDFEKNRIIKGRINRRYNHKFYDWLKTILLTGEIHLHGEAAIYDTFNLEEVKIEGLYIEFTLKNKFKIISKY